MTFIKSYVWPVPLPDNDLHVSIDKTLYSFVLAEQLSRNYTHFILAMKIHISLETKLLLDDFGGFTIEPRGYITMKVCLTFIFGCIIILILK